MKLSGTVEILWLILIGLEVLSVFAGLARKLHIQYPTFISFLAFIALRSLVLRTIGYGHVAYFWTYWIASVAEDVLLVAVLAELGHKLFLPLKIVPRDPKAVFQFLLFGVMLPLSVLLPIFSGSGFRPKNFDWYIFAVAKTFAAISYYAATGTVVISFGLTRYLRLPWKRRSALIAVGLFINYGVISWYWFQAISSTPARMMALQWVHLTASLTAQAFWLGACFAKEKRAIKIPPQSVPVLARHTEQLARKAAACTGER